ncbi:PilW family protein [Teredinibacter haidensis]|uniref:PilW family protein n=1 Tax=Teredinibacter haidensis TaxID=2731755 RepID=UPI0009F870C5|nr:PilW family protein [Teredinibacter haidensis]
MTVISHRMRQQRYNQRGVSLVEVLVSITVGLFILAGVVQLYASSSANAVVVSGSTIIQENARYIFSRLADDISQAGYAGCFNLAATDIYGSVKVERMKNIVADHKTVGELFDFSSFVDGANEVALNDLTFDSVTLRYASAQQRLPIKSASGTTLTVDAAVGSIFKKGDIALVSDCSRSAVFRVANEPEKTGVISFAKDDGKSTFNDSTDLEMKIYGSDDIGNLKAGMNLSYLFGGKTGPVQYRIDTSAAGGAVGKTCSVATPQYCALFRKVKTSGKGDELVEGVESFEVEYGWQDYSDSDKLYFADASGAAGKWALIDRVKVTVTFNSINRAPTSEGSKLLSRTYSRLFLLKNQFPADNNLRN